MGGEAGADGKRFAGIEVMGLFEEGTGFGWVSEREATGSVDAHCRDCAVAGDSGMLRGLISVRTDSRSHVQGG